VSVGVCSSTMRPGILVLFLCGCGSTTPTASTPSAESAPSGREATPGGTTPSRRDPGPSTGTSSADTSTRAELGLVRGEVRDVVDLDAQNESSCAVRADGRVLCWGRNADGALDDGDGAFRLPRRVASVLRPTFVPGVEDAVEVEIVQRSASCVRTRSGDVECWGQDAPAWTGVRQIAAGDGTLCALLEGGAVRCVGARGVEDTPDAGMVEVGADGGRACSRDEDGSVWCWGLDVYGMASGTSGTSDRVPPRRLRLPRPATSLGVGNTVACAVLTDRRVACWGEGFEGVELVSALRGASHVEAGAFRDVCGALEDAVVCVTGNERRRLSLDAQRVAVGAYHGCAVVEGGVRCWGRPMAGELGDGGSRGSATPVEVARDVRELLLQGGTSSWMRRTDGSLFAPASNRDLRWIAEWPRHHFATRCVWREGGEARCLRSEYAEPTEATFTDVREIDGGNELACVLDTSATLRCTQMARGAPRSDARFVAPGPIEDVVDFCAHGRRQVCAATEDGRVRCFRGLRDAEGSVRPSPGVDALRGVEVACSRRQVCARTRAGSVSCVPYEGEEADVVVAGSGVTSLRAGRAHFCGLLGDGRVACWGENAMGQLGDGSLVSRPTMAPVPGTDDALEVDCGADHTCVRSEGGVVRCFGRSEDHSGIPWPADRREAVVVP